MDFNYLCTEFNDIGFYADKMCLTRAILGPLSGRLVASPQRNE